MTVTAEICPNCGAPLKIENGRCAFCESPLRLSGPIVAGMDAPIQSAPVGDATAPFSMTVEDVFTIKGRGTIATGKIAAGTLLKGASIVLEHGGKNRAVVVVAIEMFRAQLDAAVPGNNVGILLKDEKHKDLKADDVARGDTLRAP